MLKSRRLKAGAAFLALIGATVLLFQNCSGKFSPAAGGSNSAASLLPTYNPPPLTNLLDGRYSLMSWSCGATDILSALGPALVDISLQGTSGSENVQFPDTCVAQTALSVSYPDTTHVSLQAGATTCSGSCQPAECTATSAAGWNLEFDFSLTANTVALTHALNASDLTNLGLVYGPAGCAAGSVATLVAGPQLATQSLPFAYQAEVDTLAYMSCSGVVAPASANAYFSYRALASANADSGLAMASNFASATQDFSIDQRAGALGAGDYNSQTLLSLSIRQTTNYQTWWQEAGAPLANALAAMTPALGSPAAAAQFAGLSAQPLIDLAASATSVQALSGSLIFYDTEPVAAQTRTDLGNGTSILAIGFAASTNSTDTSLRSPSDADYIAIANPPVTQNQQNSVWGNGYSLAFALPNGISAGDARVLTSVSEKNLASGMAIANTWNCSTSYQFMIVRPEDLTASLVTCATAPDNAVGSAQVSALAAIRRVLSVNDWFVDLNNHCIVPKGTTDLCYGPLGSRQIQYTSPSCTDSSSAACPHYVSVCVLN